jgi:hypothetical protein
MLIMTLASFRSSKTLEGSDGNKLAIIAKTLSEQAEEGWINAAYSAPANQEGICSILKTQKGQSGLRVAGSFSISALAMVL